MHPRISKNHQRVWNRTTKKSENYDERLSRFYKIKLHCLSLQMLLNFLKQPKKYVPCDDNFRVGTHRSTAISAFHWPILRIKMLIYAGQDLFNSQFKVKIFIVMGLNCWEHDSIIQKLIRVSGPSSSSFILKTAISHAQLRLDGWSDMRPLHISLNTVYSGCKPSRFMSSFTFSPNLPAPTFLQFIGSLNAILQDCELECWARMGSRNEILKFIVTNQNKTEQGFPSHFWTSLNCTLKKCIASQDEKKWNEWQSGLLGRFTFSL